MKGIILAGGSGTRLYPCTMGVSKQLLPIYNKPMIFYPLSVLMLSGLKEIAIVTTTRDLDQFKRLLGDGSQWGMSFTYITQSDPEGIAQAYVLSEEYLAEEPSVLILGDNIFYGQDLPETMQEAYSSLLGGSIFLYRVKSPEQYGVATLDSSGIVTKIVEKPINPESRWAVTGMYLLDGSAPKRAYDLKKSERGEYEIVTLLEKYLAEKRLKSQILGRGVAWLDTGTHESLLDAGNFVRTIEKRQGFKIGCPEEIAYSNGWITSSQVKQLAKMYKHEYSDYILSLVKE